MDKVKFQPTANVATNNKHVRNTVVRLNAIDSFILENLNQWYKYPNIEPILRELNMAENRIDSGFSGGFVINDSAKSLS